MMAFQPGNQLAKLKGKKKKEYLELLEKGVPDAIACLIQICKSSGKDRDRIAAATVLLDRCYGKPSQSLRVDHTQPIDQSAVMAALADQARGVLIDVDEDGAQRIMVTPRTQLSQQAPIDVDTLHSEYEEAPQ